MWKKTHILISAEITKQTKCAAFWRMYNFIGRFSNKTTASTQKGTYDNIIGSERQQTKRNEKQKISVKILQYWIEFKKKKKEADEERWRLVEIMCAHIIV